MTRLTYYNFLETALYRHDDYSIKSIEYHHHSINGYNLRYAMRRLTYLW
jgi:hypothetical protein